MKTFCAFLIIFLAIQITSSRRRTIFRRHFEGCVSSGEDVIPQDSFILNDFTYGNEVGTVDKQSGNDRKTFSDGFQEKAPDFVEGYNAGYDSTEAVDDKRLQNMKGDIDGTYDSYIGEMRTCPFNSSNDCNNYSEGYETSQYINDICDLAVNTSTI